MISNKFIYINLLIEPQLSLRSFQNPFLSAALIISLPHVQIAVLSGAQERVVLIHAIRNSQVEGAFTIGLGDLPLLSFIEVVSILECKTVRFGGCCKPLLLDALVVGLSNAIQTVQKLLDLPDLSTCRSFV